MKKLTLALLLALCGTRVYGQLPQEVTVKAEEIAVLNAALETAMTDTKSIDAVCQELGLQKEDVKSWFARHKVLTGAGCSLLGVYATLLGLSYCGQEANGQQQGPVTKMIKVRNALSKLAWAQKPVELIAKGSKSGLGHVKNNKKVYAYGTLAAIVLFAIAWEAYQGKDSAVAALLNKLFGKKEAAPVVSEVVTEEAKTEVAPATEVVAPTAA